MREECRQWTKTKTLLLEMEKEKKEVKSSMQVALTPLAIGGPLGDLAEK